MNLNPPYKIKDDYIPWLHELYQFLKYPIFYNIPSILSSTSGVNLNAAADTETSLYTVPVGRSCIVTQIVIRTMSADANNSVITFGVTGGSCDEFRGDQTLSGLDGTTKYTVIYLDQDTNDTPEAAVLLTAGDTFGVEITTQAGNACTCTMDVIGYLF